MNHQTSKLKIIASLLSPSASGWVFYVFLSGMGMVLNQFDLIKHYLELPHDFDLLHVLSGFADTVLTKTIGESRTETLVVGMFWAVVGLIVYMFLRGLARLVIELDDDLGVRGFVWPKGTDRYRPLRIFAEQFAFRLAALIGLVLTIFLPLAAVLRGPIFVDFLGSNQIVQFVVWFIAGVITWHLIVVMLRLMTLRARLFG